MLRMLIKERDKISPKRFVCSSSHGLSVQGVGLAGVRKICRTTRLVRGFRFLASEAH